MPQNDHNLIAINPATDEVMPGILPPSLVNPRRKLYRNAMAAVDELEEGLVLGDRTVVRKAQAVIRHTGKKIKQSLCAEYRYPNPDRDSPDLWSVLCTSGQDGQPFKHEACVGCLFFDTSNNPRFSADKYKKPELLSLALPPDPLPESVPDPLPVENSAPMKSPLPAVSMGAVLFSHLGTVSYSLAASAMLLWQSGTAHLRHGSD